ncbi:hypothetical protein EMIT093MI4_10634 [Pseudomonas sp. IT-93MI4]
MGGHSFYAVAKFLIYVSVTERKSKVHRDDIRAKREISRFE